MIAKKYCQVANLPEFVNNAPLVCPETNQLSILEKGIEELEETRENVCLLAAKHIKTVRSQKLLVQMKFHAANHTIGPISTRNQMLKRR